MNKIKENCGFALYELLFIMFLLIILVTLTISIYINFTNQALDTNIQNTAGSFRNLMAMYYQV